MSEFFTSEQEQSPKSFKSTPWRQSSQVSTVDWFDELREAADDSLGNPAVFVRTEPVDEEDFGLFGGPSFSNFQHAHEVNHM